MIKVELNFASVPDMLAFFAGAKSLSSSQSAYIAATTPAEDEDGQETVAPTTSPAKRGRKPKAMEAQPEVAENTGSAGSEQSTVVPPPAEASAVAEEDAPKVKGPSSSAPSIEAVRKALNDLSARKNITSVATLLQGFGATRVSELTTELYPAVIAAAEAM